MRLSFLLLLISSLFGVNTGLPHELSLAEGVPLVCSDYYSIDLVTTRNVPGTGQATGTARMAFEANPFGIAIAKDGSYVHQLDISMKKINEVPGGKFVVWATTPSLDRIVYLTTLDDEWKGNGSVSFNKYLVVITFEKENFDPVSASMWEGPIAFRGMSRSGKMHTMAGHGPFDQEPCAKYGY